MALFTSEMFSSEMFSSELWARGVAETAWTPAQLFAGGATGVWYDPADLSTVFTDTAGTIPAVPGDLIALILDKSGNDHHASQPAASARPILRQDANGRYYLEFDGVDDNLLLSLTIAASDFTFSIAHAPSTAAGTGVYLFDSETERLIVAHLATTMNQTGFHDTTAWRAVGAASAAKQVQTWRLAEGAGTAGIYRDGALVGTADYVATAIGGKSRIGCIWSGGGNLYGGDIYGVVLCNKSVSTPDRQRLEQYLANQAGVTLP